MKPYQSPNNPKVTIIPPDPKIVQKEEEKREALANLNHELSDLYNMRTAKLIRIETLEDVRNGINAEIEKVTTDLNEMQERILELEKICKYQP